LHIRHAIRDETATLGCNKVWAASRAGTRRGGLDRR
jgi:hypothetical protein